jgi:hypothetical protein
MNTNLPPRDPIAAYQRKAVAERRIGKNKRCACGESRPEALITGTKPIICAACQRQKRGIAIMDNHHVAGRANSPVTISVPVNDHRAELNTLQYDWPKLTRENPHGSPLLKMAACVRGFIDTIIHLVEKLLGWIPKTLELLDAVLTSLFGQWWTAPQFAGVFQQV